MTGRGASIRYWTYQLVFRSPSGIAMRMVAKVGSHWWRWQLRRCLARLIR